ncbi:hypothetical protein Bca4012_028198 [Brassica carinata]|uniref:Factor of DNA methylation 1-5/IDN2 domain-containing protein n=1 Tax=Brassica carinata TaxID=52824 RepID=A0A8X8AWK0_BRACI|nr:hypothetical protein Bca52824_025229 [Brassica carinata]
MDVDEIEKIMEKLEETKEYIEKMMEETEEKMGKLKKELIEDLEKAEKMSEQKLKKIRKEHNEELTKIRKEHNEELKNVITEKNEMVRIVMKENDKRLEEKRRELEELEDANSRLIVKERQSTDEIQEACTELIRGLRALSGEGSMIGVKRMGEVDEKLFLKVCRQRFNGENVELQHAMLCLKWQKALHDSAWYPFKRVEIGEKMKEVVDDEDEKLKKLSEEWGEDVKNAVKTALEEMNEFNPCGRFTVHVLWNFEHGGKATLKEGIAHMAQQIKNLKRKRT